MSLSHWLFDLIWRPYLRDERGRRYRIVKIRGWNRVLYDTPGGSRHNATFLPRWLPSEWRRKS